MLHEGQEVLGRMWSLRSSGFWDFRGFGFRVGGGVRVLRALSSGDSKLFRPGFRVLRFLEFEVLGCRGVLYCAGSMRVYTGLEKLCVGSQSQSPLTLK